MHGRADISYRKFDIHNRDDMMRSCEPVAVEEQPKARTELDSLRR